MAVERTFSVRMVGDAQQLIKEFSKVSKTASGLFGASGVGGALSKLIPSFRTMSIAGTAAFGAVTAAAGLAVKAAMQDAESQELLAQTLKSTFGESEALRVETEKLISQFQISAAVADDQLRPAFGALIRATGDFAQSQKLLQVALDISAGTGRDLESVTIALARASQGSMTALTRLGVPLDQNAVKAKDFNKIVAQLADTFEGQASVKANSAAGRFRAFGIAVDELREQFGMMLLPTLTEIVGFLTDRLIPAVQLAIDQFRSQGVRAGLAYFVAAFGEAGKAVLAQIQAIGQGIFNFLGGVVNALRPLFAAIDLVRSFLAFGKPVVSIEKMIEDASLGMADAFAKFGAEVDYATKKLGIIAAGPMDVVERRLAATTRTATGTRSALDDLGDGATSAGKKIGAAGNEVKKFKDRLQDYTSAAKSAKSASDAFKRSQERVADSQLSVADAQSALAAAEAELARAQQGGSPEERAAAERTVAAAQRGLARAQFNVEESAIAVRDAERRLAEVRADSSSTADDIRRAEIAVEEAHFAVADAQDSLIEDTGRLAEARRDLRIATEGLRDGDAELLPFQMAVSEMQRRLEEASRAHKDALEEETEALNEYREALERVQQMAAMVPRYSAANPVTGLFPMPTVPTPSPAFVPNQVMLPDTVNINVNSSIVNSLQVAQEIQDYLDQLNRVYGNYSPVG